MSGPLTVLLVLPAPTWGGAEALAAELLGTLDVRVVALAEGPAAEEARRRWGDVTVVPVGRSAGSIARGTARLARLFRRSDADVVLANGVKAAAVAVPAARLAGLPVVWAKHDFSFDRRLARPLARSATSVVASSPAVAAATGRADVVIVTPPRPPEPLPAERLADGERTVACVGRLVPYKGFDTAIEALARPKAERWHVAVIGDDDPAEPGERKRLAALADRLGVAERVHLLGPVPEAGRRLAGFDAVAVLTRTDPDGRGREGWSMVADEAMAAGVPLVAATGGAVTDRLAGAGLAVPPDDPDAVADALARLDDDDLRRRLGAQGRAAAARLPTAEEAAARFTSVLAAAANRPGAGSTSAGPPMTVVVPARNEAATAEASLRALVAQLGDDDEVIVVHDPSVDDTRAVLDRVSSDVGSRLRVVHREPPASGIASARNEGIRRARHGHIACTDIGCLVQPGWLAALRRPFAAEPAPDLVTGLYAVSGETPLERAFALGCYPHPAEARRAGPWARLYGRVLGRAYDPTLPTGRSMAFTKEAWASVGGFPEHLATAEDVGFGRALAAAGRRCVLSADAVVVWDPRADLAETARMYERYGVGDGRSGDRLLVGRNVVRMAAYGLGPLLFLRGRPPTKAAVVVAAAVYLSLPVARAASSASPATVYLLLPVALAVKDVAKGVGCLKGLLVHWRS